MGWISPALAQEGAHSAALHLYGWESAEYLVAIIDQYPTGTICHGAGKAVGESYDLLEDSIVRAAEEPPKT